MSAIPAIAGRGSPSRAGKVPMPPEGQAPPACTRRQSAIPARSPTPERFPDMPHLPPQRRSSRKYFIFSPLSDGFTGIQKQRKAQTHLDLRLSLHDNQYFITLFFRKSTQNLTAGTKEAASVIQAPLTPDGTALQSPQAWQQMLRIPVACQFPAELSSVSHRIFRQYL